MFKTYLKTAWRNVLKSKLFSIINVIGLSVGLTCCMLITLYIVNETSYDAWQKSAGNIYQLGTEFIGVGNLQKLPNTPAPMGEMMKANFPEIKQTARLVSLFAEDKTVLISQQRLTQWTLRSKTERPVPETFLRTRWTLRSKTERPVPETFLRTRWRYLRQFGG